MFGQYHGTFRYENGDILVENERIDGLLTYRRRCVGHAFERILVASKNARITINPVEPVNLPKDITDLLLIEFTPIVIEPGTMQTVYLKFPVEVGVFLESEKGIEVLDIFSAGTQKYTLYGPPAGGVIARWYRSVVYPEIPSVERFREGVMELSILNTSSEWAHVSCAVFNGVDMKIFYNGDIVATTATMKIISPAIAETGFIDAPLIPGMTRSVELYKARKIRVIGRGYLMEWGL
ncbi:MAG: DUF432 domain-containing protein [Methanomicrobiales archaeon]|nr:DUF432 domain-containing protein [Methanomicrobiales archaeon]